MDIKYYSSKTTTVRYKIEIKFGYSSKQMNYKNAGFIEILYYYPHVLVLKVFVDEGKFELSCEILRCNNLKLRSGILCFNILQIHCRFIEIVYYLPNLLALNVFVDKGKFKLSCGILRCNFLQIQNMLLNVIFKDITTILTFKNILFFG